MATSRCVSYCQLRQDKTTQYESPANDEYDDGSKALHDLEEVVEKMNMIERWINQESDALVGYIRNYLRTMERFGEFIKHCKFLLLNQLCKQEEKTREMKKLNLLMFEIGDESYRRSDEETVRRVENLLQMATNTYINVEWATQLENTLPGMQITRVRFYNENDKKMALSAESNLLKKGIYLDHDFTKSELKRQREIDEMAEKARASGKMTFVWQDTVCIDGTFHTFV